LRDPENLAAAVCGYLIGLFEIGENDLVYLVHHLARQPLPDLVTRKLAAMALDKALDHQYGLKARTVRESLL